MPRVEADASQGDAALIREAAGGNRAAFDLLYRQHARMVHGILLAHVSWSDAEDLMQDVFLIALERLGSLRDPAAFGGWLAAIARSRATDFHRRRSRFEQRVPERQQAAPEPEAFLVMSIIHDLPECYRETLILRLLEGMTGPEIAQRTGLKEDSVRVNLCRGMKMLRARLGWEPSHER